MNDGHLLMDVSEIARDSLPNGLELLGFVQNNYVPVSTECFPLLEEAVSVKLLKGKLFLKVMSGRVDLFIKIIPKSIPDGFVLERYFREHYEDVRSVSVRCNGYFSSRFFYGFIYESLADLQKTEDRFLECIDSIAKINNSRDPRKKSKSLFPELVSNYKKRKQLFMSRSVALAGTIYRFYTKDSMIERALSGIEEFVKSFDRYASAVSSILLVFSHGDAHTKNIMEDDLGGVKFIDWDEFGFLPVGADLARLFHRQDILSVLGLDKSFDRIFMLLARYERELDISALDTKLLQFSFFYHVALLNITDVSRAPTNRQVNFIVNSIEQANKLYRLLNPSINIAHPPLSG